MVLNNSFDGIQDQLGIVKIIGEKNLNHLIKEIGEKAVLLAIRIANNELSKDKTLPKLTREKQLKYIATTFKNRLSEVISGCMETDVNEDTIVKWCLDASKGKLARFHVACATKSNWCQDKEFVSTIHNLIVAKVVHSFREATGDKLEKFQKKNYVCNLFLNTLKNNLIDYKINQLAEKRGSGFEILPDTIESYNKALLSLKYDCDIDSYLSFKEIKKNVSAINKKGVLYDEDKALIESLKSMHMPISDVADILSRSQENEVINYGEHKFQINFVKKKHNHFFHSKFCDRFFNSMCDFEVFAKNSGFDKREVLKMSRELKIFKIFEPLYSWHKDGDFYSGKVKFVNLSTCSIHTVMCSGELCPHALKAKLKKMMISI